MKSSKSKAGIIGLVMLSLFIQAFIISAILSSGNEKGKLVDRKTGRDNIGSSNYQYSEDEELDDIERSKKANAKDENLDDEDDETDKTEELQSAELSTTGKVSVDLSFDSGESTKDGPQKSKSDKVKNPNQAQASKKSTTYNIEKVKEMAIGKWKGVNNSNGKYSDVYIEFFADGSYHKYGENKDNMHKGKYTFSSPNKIKITYENADKDDVGWSAKENESFTADINFKDEENFSVKDTNRFSFANYKKVN